MLDLRQLRSFVTVADTLHFARAADVLHLAQSALSTHIRQLEDELGVRLFNRGKRAAVSLTDAGRLFVAEAEAVLRQLERADRIGRLVGRGEIGQLDLGYVVSAAVSGVLPRTLEAFRATHPAVRLNLLGMDTPSQLRGIADGLIDAGIVRSRPSYPDDVRSVTIHREPLRLALATSNPLAAQPAVPAQALLRQDFIAPQFDEAVGFAEYLLRLGQAAGGTIVPAYRVGDFVSAISMAAAGYGVVLVPGSFERLGMDGVTFRPIAGYDETVSLALAYRRFEPSPGVRAFVSLLETLAAIDRADQ